jgi:hypothetical protein
VNDHAEVSVIVLVPKLSKIAAMVLRKIENSCHEKNVLSVAK